MARRVRAWVGKHGWEAALFAAVAGVIAAQVVGRLVADPDLWGHVLFGELILAHGLPETDPFAYTSGTRPWINHEILSEVVFGWAHARFGASGLQAVRYAVTATIVLLLWREMSRRGMDNGEAALATALVATGMGAGLATVRPHLFSYIFFLLVLVGLHRIEEGQRRWVVLVPLIIAVWINFHGGVLAGVGVVGLWWAGEGGSSFLGRRKAVPFRRATLLLVLSVLALLVNPYGWQLPVFLLDTATEARPIIVEWETVAADRGALALWTAFTAVALAVLRRSRVPIRLSHGLVLAALAFLPLLAVRHLPLYAIGWGVLLSPHAPDLVEQYRRRRRRGRVAGPILGLEALLVAAGVGVAAAGTVVVAESPGLTCVPLPSEDDEVTAPPLDAVHVLERSGVSGNLATPFNWGEYVIWRLGPRVQVGMDGRRETVYPDSVYEDFKRYRVGAGDWSRWLDAYGADMALVVAGSPPDNLLALAPGWREAHRDDLAAVYGREAWPGTDEIATASTAGPGPPDHRCFPAGPRAGGALGV